MPPKVSIVITCYNYGKYISQCLRSVLDQTFTDFEAIIINDGSTDDSEEKIRPFLKEKCFKYIWQENSGQARAKNRGIMEASGAFVAFLDADDYWEPTKLEKQLPLFNDERVGVVYSRARYIDAEGNDLRKEIEEFGRYLAPKAGNVVEDLLFDNFVPFSSSVVRRDLLGNGFDERLKMAIDWKLWLYLSVNWRFAYVDEKLLNYRLGHSGQMSKNAEERFRCTDMIMEEFLGQYSKMINKKILRKAIADRFYLRWEYFRHSKPKVAKRYLIKAMKEQLDWMRIIKGFYNF